MLIELSNVSKSFAGQQVIKGCNLSIKAAGFVALMGKSGAGKSTLLSLMAGLINPDAGHIIVGGSDISHMSEEERAVFRLKNIGIIFQDFKLIPSLSVYDNIYLAVHPRRDMAAAEKEASIKDLIANVGLRSKENQVVSELSGGQKQRVAIARSLVNRPLVVLADEPTGSLDSATAAEILNLFDTVHGKYQTAFIIATHDSEVAQRTQAIYRIKDGEIQ